MILTRRESVYFVPLHSSSCSTLEIARMPVTFDYRGHELCFVQPLPLYLSIMNSGHNAHVSADLLEEPGSKRYVSRLSFPTSAACLTAITRRCVFRLLFGTFQACLLVLLRTTEIGCLFSTVLAVFK